MSASSDETKPTAGFLNKQSGKFFLAAVVLFAISGASIFFLASQTLERVSSLYAEMIAEMEVGISERSSMILEDGEKLNSSEVEKSELSNALELQKRGAEIEQRKSYLRGRYQGALLIISSQLESVLAPMDSGDREMFLINDGVYLSVLKEAKAVKYWGIWDEDTLDEVADFEEMEDAHKAALGRLLTSKSNASNAQFEFDPAENIIRILAMLGPTDEPFGMIEVVVDDELTPLTDQANAVATEMQAALDKQKAELAAAYASSSKATRDREAAAKDERDIARADAADLVTQAQIIQGTLAAIVTVIGAVVTFAMVVFLVTRPLGRVIAIMGRIVAGDTSMSVERGGRKDEIGDVLEALETFRRNSEENTHMQREIGANRVAAEQQESLASILQEAILMIRPLVRQRNLTVEFDPEAQDFDAVRVDRKILLQILVNLLSNAAKYNHDAGSISIEISMDDEDYAIAVSDTGPGIASKDIEKLFEPFERLGVEGSNIQGTGVGLTITRNLTDLLGGAINVVSRVGHGSTFAVRLPIAGSEAKKERGEDTALAAQ